VIDSSVSLLGSGDLNVTVSAVGTRELVLTAPDLWTHKAMLNKWVERGYRRSAEP